MALGNRINILGAGLSWHKAPELAGFAGAVKLMPGVLQHHTGPAASQLCHSNIDLISRRIGISVIFTQCSDVCR